MSPEDALRKQWAAYDERICQELGKALGFPWFYQDQKNFPGATRDDGVCVGDLCAIDVVRMAARRLQGKPEPDDD